MVLAGIVFSLYVAVSSSRISILQTLAISLTASLAAAYGAILLIAVLTMGYASDAIITQTIVAAVVIGLIGGLALHRFRRLNEHRSRIA
jgi:hypothetical protein